MNQLRTKADFLDVKKVKCVNQRVHVLGACAQLQRLYLRKVSLELLDLLMELSCRDFVVRLPKRLAILDASFFFFALIPSLALLVDAE